MKKEINIIAAKSKNNVIGNNNEMLWRIPKDLKHFKDVTLNSIVVMGRKTFNSIGIPLPYRLNIVITSRIEHYSKIYSDHDNILFINDYYGLFNIIDNENYYDKIFVIGGETIYKYFIDNNLYDNIYLTELENIFPGDTYFPNINLNAHNKKTIDSGEHNGLIYNINLYSKKTNY